MSFALFAASVARSGSMVFAALAGTSVALAAGVHGLGHFLTPILGTWAGLEALRQGETKRRVAGLAAIVVIAHAASFLSAQAAFGAMSVQSQSGWWTQFLEQMPEFGRLPGVVWYEFVRPYGVLAVWLVFACTSVMRRTPVSAENAALALGMTLLLVTTWILVPHGDERGAYLTPLGFLLALSVAREKSLVSRLLLFGACANLLVAVLEVRMHERPNLAKSWIHGLRECAGKDFAQVFPLVGEVDEIDALARYEPLRPSLVASDLVAGLADGLSHAELRIRSQGVVTLLRQIEAGGRSLVASASWRAQMQRTAGARMALAAIQESWKFEERSADDQRFYLLRAR